MSHVKSGHVSASGEWAKHLRPSHKRAFWKRHRKVEDACARTEAGYARSGALKRTRLAREGLNG